jgi:hypothetical protein
MISRLRLGAVCLTSAALSLAGACQDRPLGWSTPERLRVSIDNPVQYLNPKIDLLFVIDNRRSMADKQPWLGSAVFRLVERLVNPPCVDAETRLPLTTPGDPRDSCNSGKRRMTPVHDLHVGFITSSLGGHGHETHCEAPQFPEGNDRAHLLPTVRDLDVETYRDQGLRKNPVCQDSGGAYATVQLRGQAQPGLRQLEVLHGLDWRSTVASICPKVSDPTSPSYAFSPAFDTLVRRLTYDPGGRCLPLALPVDPETGHVPCSIVEALPEDRCLADCGLIPGRRSLDDVRLEAHLRSRLLEQHRCGPEMALDCTSLCLCEIQQLEGRAPGQPLWQCQNLTNAVDPDIFGYCYVDPSQGAGDDSLVASCPSSERRDLRFLGEETPRNGATVMIACVSRW